MFSEYEMNCAVGMEERTLWCHVGIPCYVMLCVETAVMVGDIRAMYGRCACMYGIQMAVAVTITVTVTW